MHIVECHLPYVNITSILYYNNIHYIHPIYTLPRTHITHSKSTPKSDSGPKDDYLGFRLSASFTPVYTYQVTTSKYYYIYNINTLYTCSISI